MFVQKGDWTPYTQVVGAKAGRLRGRHFDGCASCPCFRPPWRHRSNHDPSIHRVEPSAILRLVPMPGRPAEAFRRSKPRIVQDVLAVAHHPSCRFGLIFPGVNLSGTILGSSPHRDSMGGSSNQTFPFDWNSTPGLPDQPIPFPRLVPHRPQNDLVPLRIRQDSKRCPRQESEAWAARPFPTSRLISSARERLRHERAMRAAALPSAARATFHARSREKGAREKRTTRCASAGGGDPRPGKSFDARGAGKTISSPGWLTALQRNWGGKSNIPVADAKPEQVADLLGGAIFLALYRWFRESGPVYLLPTGPVTSFVVLSEPESIKYVLRNYSRYEKGLVSEISQFLFGDGFAVAEGEKWKIRRKAVGPAFHKTFLTRMVDLVFAPCSVRMVEKLDVAAQAGRAIDLEACFSQVTLDVVGKAVFNYDFDALNKDSPVIQAVYTALKETEQRATDVLPVWKFPFLAQFVPRQRKAMQAVEIIREKTEELIDICRKMVESENDEFGEEYLNEDDPSILRFLLAARDEVTPKQLRDDLLSMLVAGHETTGSVLTWTAYLLAKYPSCLKRAQQEVDTVLGDRSTPTVDDLQHLNYVMRCLNESMRLYPHPPVLIRRALEDDMLPGGYDIPKGQDVMISVYNLHRNPAVWEDPDVFRPERFDLDGPMPNENNTDFRYVPFSGGPRKCIGDQFALMEGQIVMTYLLKHFDFEIENEDSIGMTTGATIHTTNGLYMRMKRRENKVAEPAMA